MAGAMDISLSGLVAQRIRMNTIANNLANANSTRDASGQVNPYRRKDALFASALAREGDALQGVAVPAIADDPSPFREEHRPSHPDADPVTGIVRLPNVNPVLEMVDMIDATRAYEANVTVMDATKGLFASALRILA
jgi:flagellar basal-body rod protein FlgC